MKETLLKKVNNCEENRTDKGVRLCRGFGALLIAVTCLLRDSAIYNEIAFAEFVTDIAQGMAIGLLFVGLVMASRYGEKVRAFKKNLFA